MKTDGSNIKRLSVDNGIYTFQVYGNDIYYKNLNNKSIMKMSVEGGSNTIIVPDTDLKLIVYLDRIYYFKYDSTEGYYFLYSCNLDGTDVIFAAVSYLYQYFDLFT